MTRVARRFDAINLAQGFPDFAAPQLLKDAACTAIQDDDNQYAITWGTPALRTALARKYREWYGIEVDRDREVTVTCGATEAMAAVMLATIDPGDEPGELAPRQVTVNCVCPVGVSGTGMGQEILELKSRLTKYPKPIV